MKYRACYYIPLRCTPSLDSELMHATVNIYFNRHPSLAPGPAWPNFPANVVIRCALFSTPMSAAQATNYGQQRGPADGNGERFEVLVAGSNGKPSIPMAIVPFVPFGEGCLGYCDVVSGADVWFSV